MCIRCAGIHRNLGVHISKVKSVNLDSWTPHQVAVRTEKWKVGGEKTLNRDFFPDAKQYCFPVCMTIKMSMAKQRYILCLAEHADYRK
jgi:hypothetical protein